MGKKYCKQRQFKPVRNLTRKSFEEFLEKQCASKHMEERLSRLDYTEPNARPIYGFIAVVDRGHKNGVEVHALYSDGTVRIWNYQSGKVITILIAREGQAKRLNDNLSIPLFVLNKIQKNVQQGYNYR